MEHEEQTEYVSAARIVFSDEPNELILHNVPYGMTASPRNVRQKIGEEIQTNFNNGLFTPIIVDGDFSDTSEELDITRGYYHMHHIPYLPSLDHSDESSEYSSSGYSEDDSDDEDWKMCEYEYEEDQEDKEDQEDE